MNVLIAEDDPIVALGLSERLRTLGHNPIGPVGDGAQAVAEAKASLPDLYLFDIEMPTLDGLAAAVQLAGEGYRRPVVIVTGVDDPSLVERSIASGVSAYLTKPIDTRELDAALKLAAARHARTSPVRAQAVCIHAPSRCSISAESPSGSLRKGRQRRSRRSPGTRWTSATFPRGTPTGSGCGRTTSSGFWPAGSKSWRSRSIGDVR
jgi:DNA-binding NarL/FixJ family response regulator